MANMLHENMIKRVNLGDVVRRSAWRHPEKIALIEGDRRISYRELYEMVNQVGNAFLDKGFKKGDRIATIAANSSDFLILGLGLAKAGLVFCPINPVLSNEDTTYIINHMEPKGIVVDDVFLPKANAIKDQLPSLNLFLSINVGNGAIEAPYEEFRSFIADVDKKEVEVEIQDRDLAQILYTSGTTSNPKGVMISHLSIYIASLSAVIDGGIRPNDVMSVILPLFHVAQLSLSAASIQRGGTMVIFRQFNPTTFIQTIEKEKISWIFALPMMYRAILNHPDLDKTNIESLRYCLYAMAPMDNHTIREGIKRLNVEFALASGQTECYPPTVFFHPEYQLIKQGPYWGTPVATADNAIMDDEGNILPWGEVGEIVYRSPHVMEGYLKDEEATEKAFEHGWFHSGDIGMFDEDGLLFFIDRKKDIVKTGGENVSSVKVESVLMAHPDVAGVAIIGVPHSHWGEALTAVIVPKEGTTPSKDQILDYCKKQLSKFEVPKDIIFRDSLPQTATGKLQKFRLREELMNQADNH